MLHTVSDIKKEASLTIKVSRRTLYTTLLLKLYTLYLRLLCKEKRVITPN